jgi:hypothetical protein
MGSGVGISTAPMPLYMPQKRAFSDAYAEADASADNHYIKHEDNAAKKVKTENWDMGF